MTRVRGIVFLCPASNSMNFDASCMDEVYIKWYSVQVAYYLNFSWGAEETDGSTFVAKFSLSGMPARKDSTHLHFFSFSCLIFLTWLMFQSTLQRELLTILFHFISIWTLSIAVRHENLRARVCALLQAWCFASDVAWIAGCKYWDLPSLDIYPFGTRTRYSIICHIISYYNVLYCYTSSTAQGGGGSFKNRKPIGEVGCCESRMAERIHWWTERCLELCFGVVTMVAVVAWSVTSPTTAACSVA